VKIAHQTSELDGSWNFNDTNIARQGDSNIQHAGKSVVGRINSHRKSDTGNPFPPAQHSSREIDSTELPTGTGLNQN
jgi:hypothetical protein